ncbi:MAG: LysE family translocator [Saprospiraceae bacterium]
MENLIPNSGSALLQGIQLGLVLCFLLGPIFVAIIQAGIEEGFRAGVMVGFGIWVSDVLFILAVFLGGSYVGAITKWDNFESVVGSAGGVILILFGLGALLAKPLDFDDNLLKERRGLFSKSIKLKETSYWKLWTKGFVVNTFNPFTVIFWTGVMATVVIGGDMTNQDATVFFTGVLGTIIITDTFKALLAKRIRQWMTSKHITWVRRGSGIALIIFGVVLLIRVLG